MQSKVLGSLCRFPPRYGPEWGSGGIFGLRYYKGVLYFNLAFEAEAHFVGEDGEVLYRYELVGPGPASGGDTYNAVDTVDEFIYFGGWVHAPAQYLREEGRRTISFVNKYSHVHEFSVAEENVRLVWKEGINHPVEWAGEVSEIVYDPLNDRLLLARGDGSANLGVYSLNRRTGALTKLSEDPALKGTLFLDAACFNISRMPFNTFGGVQCLDLASGNWSRHAVGDLSEISVDGGDVIAPSVGCMASAYARLFVFVKGGVFVGNPLRYDEEPLKFIRLFDFALSGYGPLRTVALPVGGGILTAFNAFSNAVLNPADDLERVLKEATNTIVGPSVLVYVTPPSARIVGAFGSRITSMESFRDKILVGTSTAPNLSRLDATPIDVGYREIMALEKGILSSAPPPVSFSVPGHRVLDLAWGGIPLYGYKDAMMLVKATKGNRLDVFEYDLSLPIQQAERDSYELREGKNIIDLKGHQRIISFRLEEEDPRSWIHLHLR